MMKTYRYVLLAVLVLLLAGFACVREPAGPVIIVTATPAGTLGIATLTDRGGPPSIPSVTAPPVPQSLIVPTMDPPRLETAEPLPDSYTVQPGDSVSAIAERFGTSVEQLVELNALADASLISVGQVLQLPETTAAFSPSFKIIPDSELVRSPASATFDIAGYISALPGYLRTYTEPVDGEDITAAEIVRRVADDFSINPRLLLALLEMRAGWLFDPEPPGSLLLYPMGYVQLGYEGLHKQLSWTANRLNEAYYGWRARALLWFAFPDGVRVMYAPGINAGTAAVQYFLSLNQSYSLWLAEVQATGFYSLYVDLFGDPFGRAVEPLLPPDLAQPPMQLPWAAGELWYYTGGPHGGYGTGSAWSAVDFAPPGDEDTAGCFVAPQAVTAVADGLVVRSERGFVILDLDGDGNETTGWTVVYLHLATEGRIAAGTPVRAGDVLGYPSCEGGVSNATHLHIARRYNGEWIPAHCHHCAPGVPDVPFVLGGWTIRGWENQEYQGYMISGPEYRQAEQGRDTELNQLIW